jgi:diguanylate cyclase (GGDEF)-like protein
VGLGRSAAVNARKALRAPWVAWSIVGCAVIVAYLAIEDEALRLVVYDALALAAAGMVVFGIARNRPRPVMPWIMLAVGIALLAGGDIVYDLLSASGPVPDPSLADLPYILGSLALVGAAALQLLRHGRPVLGFLDAFVIGTAFAVVLWTLVVDPQLDEGAVPLVSFAVIAAYPAIDVAMLSILSVALLGGMALDRSTGLFMAAAFAFLVSDVAYAALGAMGGYVPGAIDVGWLLGYVLWGAAALSVARSSPRTAAMSPDLRLWRTIRPFVLIAAVASPLAMALVERTAFDADDGFAGAVTSVLVSVVVIVRLEYSLSEKRRLLDDRHRLEATLQRRAMEDPLTELPNRRALTERLTEALEEARGAALLLMDIDDFKSVNDALGHQAGDALLRAIAGRLRSVVRDSDMVVRFGGDEFAVVLAPCPRAEVAIQAAERLLGCLDEPVSTDRGQVTTSISVGVALAGRAGPGVEQLVRDADLALYRAKSEGKHRWAMLDPETRALAMRSLSIAGQLPRALAEREFALSFQPIVSLADATLESFEALLRWEHPSLGVLQPSEFLPALERSTQMPAVGRWVLEEACSAAAGWRRSGLPEVGVNVNVSAAQLADDRFPDMVLEALERCGLPAAVLTLEILESGLEVSPALTTRLERLHDAGVRLAIDDFGTGFSSLSRVAEIPVDELKLDRSLVASSSDRRMVGAIVRLGHTLGLRLVAEGVETAEELREVRALGCDAAQGYRISRPIAAGEVASFMRSWTTAQPRWRRAIGYHTLMPSDDRRRVPTAAADGRRLAPRGTLRPGQRSRKPKRVVYTTARHRTAEPLATAIAATTT